MEHKKKKIKDNKSPVYLEYKHIPIIKNDFDRLIQKRNEKTN